VIVSSTIVEDHAQPNGDRDIWERHIFDDGLAIDVRYRAAAGGDVAAALRARAPFLEQQRSDEEAAAADAALQASIAAKYDAYLAALPDAVLTADVGLTLDELTWASSETAAGVGVGVVGVPAGG
jgi:hypothetical protein